MNLSLNMPPRWGFGCVLGWIGYKHVAPLALLGPDREALTQAIARAAFEHLAEGLVMPSARLKGGVNIHYLEKKLGMDKH